LGQKLHPVSSPQRNFNIDLNNDGTEDFAITARSGTNTCYPYSCGYDPFAQLTVRKLGDNKNRIVIGSVRGFARAEVLERGAEIGRGQTFGAIGEMAGFGGHGSGSWTNVSNRFVGVRFIINGQFHFGWIGFRHVNDDATARLAGWAYETEPNKPILAGDRGEKESSEMRAEPTSLELLALGHTGIADRQRRIAAQGKS
jgi:hypothetical protein